MSQVRQPFRANSPSPTAVRPLPETSRSRRSSLQETQRTETIKTTDQQSSTRQPFRAIHQENFEAPPVQSRLVQPSIYHRKYDPKYDSLTGQIIQSSVGRSSAKKMSENSSSIDGSNQRSTTPKVPPRTLDRLHSMPDREQQIEPERANPNLTDIDESFDLPSLDDDDGLPVVSIENRNLPVYARFPFDVTFLPQPMETNVEDNIHRLRLRLIDSELDQQRRTAEEYLKRTHEQKAFSSSRSRDSTLYPTRPPLTSISTQRTTPKNISRQTSYATLQNGTVPINGFYPRTSRSRVGSEYEATVNVNTQRDLEIQPIPDWLPSNRTPVNPSLLVTNYAYDPRLYNEPVSLLERQYTSSNMDDLIDSMARRQLASRRFDSSLDRTRFARRPYGTNYESAVLPRQTSVLNSHRNEDIYLINAAPIGTNHIDRGLLRAYPSDFSLHVRSRTDNIEYVANENLVPRTSYSKLPPITPNSEHRAFNNSNEYTHSEVYQRKENPMERQTNSVVMNLPDHTEHFIDLPSDIFLSARTEARVSPNRRQNEIIDSETREVSRTRSVRQQSDNEQTTKSNENDHREKSPSSEQRNEFFTEEIIDVKTKRRRNPFKNAGRAMIFLFFVREKAAQTRKNPQRLTTSATIQKLRLQEVVVALHRVYLEPDGPICNSVYQTINSTIDLRDAFQSSKLNFTLANKILGETLKTITSKLVDFMPKDGVLGTGKNSSLAVVIQDGNRFPENYFWQCEKILLEFDRSKIINVTKQRAILLLIGLFILRGLVTTLLIKPVKYRLLLGELTENQKGNCKIFGSLLFYLGRRAAGFNSQILTMPKEWQEFVYTDDELQPIIQHNEVKQILMKCELSLRLWCEEYIRRIDASFGKKLRS